MSRREQKVNQVQGRVWLIHIRNAYEFLPLAAHLEQNTLEEYPCDYDTEIKLVPYTNSRSCTKDANNPYHEMPTSAM